MHNDFIDPGALSEGGPGSEGGPNPRVTLNQAKGALNKVKEMLMEESLSDEAPAEKRLPKLAKFILEKIGRLRRMKTTPA